MRGIGVRSTTAGGLGRMRYRQSVALLLTLPYASVDYGASSATHLSLQQLEAQAQQRANGVLVDKLMQQATIQQ